MRKLNSFTFLSLNGFYKGKNEDTSWHRHGREEGEYSAEALRSGNILLFGRKTYEMMSSFWPTPQAAAGFHEVAIGMNRAEKLVFSTTLKTAEWNNTKIIGGDIVAQIRALKSTPGGDLTLLGSGSIVTQFSEAGLIDCYQLMIDPVALGEGTSLFQGLKKTLEVQLINSRVFSSGTVLLTYTRNNQAT